MKKNSLASNRWVNRGLCLKKIRAEPDICRKLQFEAVRRIKRLQFLLLEYRFFKDSKEGSTLPLSLPPFLSPLSLMLHIVKSHALALLRLLVFCQTRNENCRIVGHPGASRKPACSEPRSRKRVQTTRDRHMHPWLH